MAKFAINASGAMLLPNLVQVSESISGSVVPLAMFVLHICHPFVLLELCTVNLLCKVHCAALQVVCLPFRAKPCYAKVPAPTGSEEVPIAFKFLAQPAGAVQVPKSFSQRCREFLVTLSLASLLSQHRKPEPGNLIHRGFFILAH